MDQPREGCAQAIHIVEPFEKIGGCQLVALRAMVRDGLDRSSRHLAVGGRVEIRPALQGGEFGADLIPVSHTLKACGTSARGTFLDCLVLRFTTSTMPCGSFLPTV